MTGKAKFDAAGQKIKEEVEAKNQAETTAIEKVKQRLATLQQNPELAKVLQEDAQNEAEKSGGSLPFLKIYVVNKSTQTLVDGKEPNDGWFFYSPTQEQYEEVHCHILTISRGFRMPGMPNEEGKIKNRWNHIVSGIMLNDEPKPFWLFISGQARVNSLWEFQKELRTYNKIGLPSFPLIIKLTTEKVKTEKSPAIVVRFEVEKDDNGFPMMEESPQEYMAIRQKVYDQEGYVEAYINRKEVLDKEPIQRVAVVGATEE